MLYKHYFSLLGKFRKKINGVMIKCDVKND